MSRSYKVEKRTTTVSAAVSDALSELQELGSEMREWFDNMSEGLQQTGKAETISCTADSLESVSEPDVPECVAELEVTYFESVNRDKRRGPSRAVRCENAVAMLNAAKDAVEAFTSSKGEGDGVDQDVISEVDQLVSDLDDVISEAEGCEFPSMYG
jgi:hypothetical protein